MVEVVGAMLVELPARQEQIRCRQVAQISLIATVESIEDDLLEGGPGKVLDEGELSTTHGVVGDGEEGWSPCW